MKKYGKIVCVVLICMSLILMAGCGSKGTADTASADTAAADKGAADTAAADKSIVRPTYSYLGEYTISDNVIINMAEHEAHKIEGVLKTNGTNIRQTSHGIHIDMSVTLLYGYNIYSVCKQVQLAVKNAIEEYTSINARRVHIYVKYLHI